VDAISKKGTQWVFTVESGVVSVGDMLKIETICSSKECPDGILTAADGVPTSKNNQEVPVQNAGRIYVDNDKNGFYDRDGDGRMDSTSLGFETPITEEDLKKMDITFYWLDNDGELVAIKPNIADLEISEGGTLLGFALDPGCFAAFMSIGIRENQAGVQADLGVQPAVSVGWILKVVFLKQQDVADEGSCPVGWIGEMLFPTVKAAALDTHGFTDQLYRKFSRQLHDHLVFPLPYRITVPSPFTSYPFFSRASVIRALTSS